MSPEAVELAARAGVRWLATDEGVLWHSMPVGERHHGALYQPWRFRTPAGEVALFFRDRELSDRIGFVYHHWDTAEAVADFIGRVRRIAREHGVPGRRPVVSRSSSTARTAGRTTRPTAGRSSRRSTPRSRPRPTSAP